MKKYVINSICDDSIIKLSKGEVNNASDFKVSEKSYVGIPGGIYDSKIFGQRWRCYCGKRRKVGVCQECGVEVLDVGKDSKNLGYFKLFSTVVYPVKMMLFQETLKKSLPNVFLEFNKFGKTNFDKGAYDTKLEVEECEQKEAELTNGELFFRVKISSFSLKDSVESSELYGYNGLMRIIDNYLPIENNEDFFLLKKLMNKVIPIAPITSRMPNMVDGELKIPDLSSKYCLLIHYCIKVLEVLKTKEHNLADVLMFNYKLCGVIDGVMKCYSLVAPSKQSFLRYATSVRVPSTGRAIIVGSTECDIDEIFVPRAMAYEAIKERIIKKISIEEKKKKDEDETYEPKNANYLYDTLSEQSLRIFEEIIYGNGKEETGTICILNRAPTLHRLSMMSFKVKMWDKPVIGMNIIITGPFNADFDGDTMSVFFLTKGKIKKKVYEKMSIKNSWFYDKNREPVLSPSNGIVLGIYYATRINKEDKKGSFKNLEDISNSFENQVIDYDSEICYNGKITCYGREQLQSILGFSIDKYLYNGEFIKKDGLDNIIRDLFFDKDRVKKVSNLIFFAKRIVTITGSSIASLGDLYNLDPDFSEVKKIKRICNDEKEQYIETEKRMSGMVKDKLRSIDSIVYKEAMEAGAKIKLQSLTEIFGPQFRYEEGFSYDEESLLTGLGDKCLLSHTKSNREILNQKANMVPASGYFTKQIVKLNWDVVYRKDIKSKDTIGILIPEWMANGRVTLEGEIVKGNSNKLVRVKSCATNEVNNKNIICADEIDCNFFKLENYNLLGMNLATCMTEQIMQSSLGLKHGGRTYSSPDYYLKAPEKVKLGDFYNNFFELITEDGRSLLYSVEEESIISTRLKNGEFINKGEVVIYSNKMQYIDYKLSALREYIRVVTSGLITKSIPTVDCYSRNEGIIEYDFLNDCLYIGEKKYKLDRKQTYYFHSGEKVHFGDRICSGLFDLSILSNSSIDNGEKYYIFMKQLLELLDGEGCLNDKKMSIASESIEVMFKRLIENDSMRVNSVNKNNTNVLTKASSSFAKEAISENIGVTIEDGILLRLMTKGVDLEGYGE